MTSFADQLEAASATAPADVAILLRRAALRLRNSETVPIDPAWSAALANAMVDLKATDRRDALRFIVGEWLMSNGYLAFQDIEVDSHVEGRE